MCIDQVNRYYMRDAAQAANQRNKDKWTLHKLHNTACKKIPASLHYHSWLYHHIDSCISVNPIWEYTVTQERFSSQLHITYSQSNQKGPKFIQKTNVNFDLLLSLNSIRCPFNSAFWEIKRAFLNSVLQLQLLIAFFYKLSF